MANVTGPDRDRHPAGAMTALGARPRRSCIRWRSSSGGYERCPSGGGPARRASFERSCADIAAVLAAPRRPDRASAGVRGSREREPRGPVDRPSSMPRPALRLPRVAGRRPRRRAARAQVARARAAGEESDRRRTRPRPRSWPAHSAGRTALRSNAVPTTSIDAVAGGAAAYRIECLRTAAARADVSTYRRPRHVARRGSTVPRRPVDQLQGGAAPPLQIRRHPFAIGHEICRHSEMSRGACTWTRSPEPNGTSAHASHHAPDPIVAATWPAWRASSSTCRARAAGRGPDWSARRGGAGPADAGMLCVEGVPVTVPTNAAYVADSPYVLRAEDDGGMGVYRDGERLADATTPHPTELLRPDHGRRHPLLADRACCTWTPWRAPSCRPAPTGATTTSARSAASGSPWPPAAPSPRRRRRMLAEVAVAAQDLDGAVDATLTTGSTATPDRGALTSRRCGRGGARRPPAFRCRSSSSRRANLDVIDQVADMGIDSVGIHVESFDPAGPRAGRAGQGTDRHRGATSPPGSGRSQRSAPGQVSTYVILGMGEDQKLTVEGCKRAIDMGVYPFVVPFRPVPGSLMEDVLPPSREYTERIYHQVGRLHGERGMDTGQAKAGCARCQACSGLRACRPRYRSGPAPSCRSRRGRWPCPRRYDPAMTGTADTVDSARPGQPNCASAPGRVQANALVSRACASLRDPASGVRPGAGRLPRHGSRRARPDRSTCTSSATATA